MTPKTAIERQLTELSGSLAPITRKMCLWAENKIFLKWGTLSRGKFHCMDCLHSWKPDAQKECCQNYIKCAACRGKLKMQPYNKTRFKEIEYWAALAVCGGYQVVRIICSHKYMKKGFMPDYFHKEVMQHWISAKGEARTLSLSTNSFSNAYDQWKYYTDLEIRPKSFEASPKYRINPYRVYPVRQVLPLLKRNGFKCCFFDFPPQLLFTALLRDSCAETLFKLRRMDFLKHYLLTNPQGIRKHWQAVKTCIKNGYKVQNFSIWEDYVNLLTWFKMDLGSPANVCPENLSEIHDRLVSRKMKIIRRLKMEQLRTQMQQSQMEYEKDKKQFFGLVFADRNLTISVMENVGDFLAEGELLRHCIFTNEYYAKKNSLILSAKVNEKPVETIEVALPSLKIKQRRGERNEDSPHHAQILKLLSKNLHQIKKRMKNKKAAQKAEI